MGQRADVATYLGMPDTHVFWPSQVQEIREMAGGDVRQMGSADVNSEDQEWMDTMRGNAPQQTEDGIVVEATPTRYSPSVPPAASTAPPPPSVSPPAARTAPLLSTGEQAGRGPGGAKRKAETSGGHGPPDKMPRHAAAKKVCFLFIGGCAAGCWQGTVVWARKGRGQIMVLCAGNGAVGGKW